jgi:hypothetical protein
MDAAAKREEPDIVDAQQNPNGRICCPAKHGGVDTMRYTAGKALLAVHGEIDLTSKTSCEAAQGAENWKIDEK